MAHQHSPGEPCPPCVKKVLNNTAFIAVLAALLGSSEAASLATAARAYADILTWLGIKPDLDGFEGCEQGQLLVRWITAGEEPDCDKVREWTAEIWSAIRELAEGNLPSA